MCVCMCGYRHTKFTESTCMCMYNHRHVCLQACMTMCMCACLHVHTLVYVYVYVLTFMQAEFTCEFVSSCIYVGLVYMSVIVFLHACIFACMQA